MNCLECGSEMQAVANFWLCNNPPCGVTLMPEDEGYQAPPEPLSELDALRARAEAAEVSYSLAESEVQQVLASLANAAHEAEALRARVAAYQDHSLALYGLLLSVREYLRGDLPEASADQLIALIGECTPEPK